MKIGPTLVPIRTDPSNRDASHLYKLGFVAAAEFVSKVAIFLFLPLVSVISDVGTLATLSLLLPMIQCLQNAFSFGSNAYLLKYYNPELNTSSSGVAFLLAAIVAFTFLFAYWCFRPFLDTTLLPAVGVLSSILVTLTLAVVNQYYSILQVSGATEDGALLFGSVRLIFFLFSLIFLYFGFNELVLYWLCVSTILLYRIGSKFSFVFCCFPQLKLLVLFGWPVFLNSVVTFLNINFSRLYYMHDLSSLELSSIGISLSFSQGCALFFSIYSRMVGPSIMSKGVTIIDKLVMIKRGHRRLLGSIFVYAVIVFVFLFVDYWCLSMFELVDSVIVLMGFVSHFFLSFNVAYTNVIFFKERAYVLSCNLVLSGLAGFWASVYCYGSLGMYSVPVGVLVSSVLQGVLTFLSAKVLVSFEENNCSTV